MSIVSNLNQKNTPDNVKRWIQNATDIIIKRGICSVHDAWQDQEIIDAIKILLKDHRLYGSKLELYQFCILRTLSDIANIIKFYKIKRDNKYMYDLEKRIHNLFEVYRILY